MSQFFSNLESKLTNFVNLAINQTITLMVQPEQKNFFDAWAVYDHVLDCNYMGHEQLFRDVQDFLAGRYADRPLSLFDLGCGSARHLAGAMAGRTVCRYLGYDLAEAALAQATENMAGFGGAVELRRGDLLEALKTYQEQFDLVFSSFALHHLVTADKSEFFQWAYKALEAQGMLLLIDVAREEGEHRPLYLDRYCGWLSSEWTTLRPDELAAICGHIRSSDFPETASVLCAMAMDAGFIEAVELSRYRWHHLWCFKK